MVEKTPARFGGAGATAGGASGPGAALSSAASMLKLELSSLTRGTFAARIFNTFY